MVGRGGIERFNLNSFKKKVDMMLSKIMMTN